MGLYPGNILVEDATGARLKLHEIRGNRFLFPGPTRFMLGGGEAVKRIDENTFLVVASGERLARVK